jgi:Uma2 family endonuclease
LATTTALLTVDEFLKLPDVEERRLELIQGEVLDMPSGGPVHERADLSVLSSDRVDGKLQDLLQGAPDLAIEMVSSETAARLRTKIRLYLKHGS